MVPSSSHPELSVAMEAPLEVPTLARRRRPGLLPYRRWVWLSLTMVLTLAITLIVLFYVGALSGNLSGNRAPTSAAAPPVQYKHHHSRPPPEAADLKPDKCHADVSDDDDDDDDGVPVDVAFVVDAESESPVHSPRSPRSQPSSPKSRNASLHLRLDMGPFAGVFADLHIETSFCVLATRSFTSNFQQLVPEITAKFANDAVLSIYTNRESLPKHQCARRFYYSLKGDERPEDVLADVRQLLDKWPELRRKMVFIRIGAAADFPQPLLDLFRNELYELPLIEQSQVAADLVLASEGAGPAVWLTPGTNQSKQ